ncbi:MAG: DUF2723 domain-containing protein [Anaerolineae bacterium]|jgi:hypothetical protein|nr:DUF2723 domain-containing protein [Anaerolineae bacterium]
MRNRERGALWGVFFVLYALTTVRDVLPADSGEFQLAAARWGILHPPGYPLYTMVGGLWLRLLPLGSLPFRLNLLSAALAATTLLLLAEAAYIWAQSWKMSQRASRIGWLVAALTLGSAPTFWNQATLANIRIPTLLFGAWALLALAQYYRTVSQSVEENKKAAESALISLALALGLGIGHHPSLAFPALGYALYLLLIDPTLLMQPRRWARPALAAVLGWALPQLYIPLRGAMPGVPLAVSGLNTWTGFWHHVLAQGFSGDMFAFATPADLALRAPLLGALFAFQFSPPLLAGIVLGWLWLLRRHWRLALGLLASWAIHSFITITYRAPQTIEYLMPAYLPMTLSLALGAAAGSQALANTQRVTRQLLPYALLLLLLPRFPAYLPDFLELAQDTSIRDRVAPLLERAPENAQILADWHWATPLWVLQQVEGTRPDVEVTYVYPVAGKEYDQVWQEAAAAVGERPLLTTHAYHWDGWTSAPLGGGYRYYRTPLLELPAELGYLPLDAEIGPLRILGYQIIGEAHPGSSIELRLAWQAVGSQEPAPSLTARLFAGDGTFLTSNDRALGSDTAVGEVRFTAFTLQLPFTLCPGTIRPTVGVYTVQDGTFNNLGEISLPEQVVSCETPRLPTQRPWPGFVTATGPFLRGVDYDVRGEQTTAYLHFCGPGQAVSLQAGEAAVSVKGLSLGECQTVSLPVATGARPTFSVAQPDGSQARLLSLPLPIPEAGELYIPFGDQMLLTGARPQSGEGPFVLTLEWQTLRPIVDDYAVSVRLYDAEGATVGTHDIQPGLGDIPTLKWVVSGGRFPDPHPFTSPETLPTAATVTVYERFRLSTLPGPGNYAVTFPLP